MRWDHVMLPCVFFEKKKERKFFPKGFVFQSKKVRKKERRKVGKNERRKEGKRERKKERKKKETEQRKKKN